MKNILKKANYITLPASLELMNEEKNNLYITKIDSSQITWISYEGVTSFTFHINTLDDKKYNFSNLVIKLYQDKIEEYIFHYTPTEQWQLNFDSGEKLNYEGELLITDIQGNQISNNKGIGASCMMIVDVPCYGASCPCTDGNGQTFYVKITCEGSGGGGGSSGPGNPNPGGPINPGGHTPTDPNTGGGGGGNNNNPNPEITPCEIGKRLRVNIPFRNTMGILKNSAQNDNFEKGFLLKPNNTGSNGGYDYTEVNGPVNGDGININLQTGDQYAGLIHSHYEKEDMLSVFSVSDLATIWDMSLYGNITNPEKNFFLGVVTANETTYLLTIEDLGKFITFGDNNLANSDLKDILQIIYQNPPYSISSNKTNIHNEQSFAKLLKNMNTGLKLMKGNYTNFYGWSTVDVDNNNNVTTNYCH